MAAAQAHRDAHHVAELRALRRDRRVGDDLHLVRERHAPRVGNGVRGELLDRAVALEEQRCHAEGQVELRSGDAFWLVFPADMVGGRLRPVHDYSFHLARGEGRFFSSSRSASNVVWLLPTHA
jgi:hypothetical protein